ncbi:MAG: GDP-mannose 4,6-dehydratase [Anaerolineae bacterium]|nr:GDP-mannose 4,6-dehydratase [Anaerolineae bacterium]
MHILITGATGFVGTHLRHYLLNKTDWTITGTAFPDRPPESCNPRESCVSLDAREKDSVYTLLAETRPGAIIHLAAQSHVPTAYKDPWGTLENNIQGQLNLLEACLELDLKPRFIVIGSGEEYGRAGIDSFPLTENHLLQPENPYSVSKVTQDMLGYQYFISYDIPVIRMRPFNHVGPGQSPRFVLPAFASQVARIEAGEQEPVLRVGNLSPARDFTDVRDVVRAYHMAIEKGEPGEVYNLASGTPCTIQSLVDKLLELSTVKIQVEIDPDRYRPADVPVIYGSAEKFQRATGWKPEIPFKQTVQDVLEEWRRKVKASPNP